MRVLALTSSTSSASIALADGTRVFERSHSVPRGHTEFMNEALDQLVKESGLPLESLDLIAVDQGPGSFTGIRVSVSVARSLCYLLKKPAFVTTSLSLLTDQVQGPSLAGINAFKNLVFCALSTDPASHRVLEPAEVEAWVEAEFGTATVTFVGDAWTAYTPDWSEGFKARVSRSPSLSDHPRARRLAEKALISSPLVWTQDWKSISPLYLRGSAAEENLRKP